MNQKTMLLLGGVLAAGGLVYLSTKKPGLGTTSTAGTLPKASTTAAAAGQNTAIQVTSAVAQAAPSIINALGNFFNTPSSSSAAATSTNSNGAAGAAGDSFLNWSF